MQIDIFNSCLCTIYPCVHAPCCFLFIHSNIQLHSFHSFKYSITMTDKCSGEVHARYSDVDENVVIHVINCGEVISFSRKRNDLIMQTLKRLRIKMKISDDQQCGVQIKATGEALCEQETVEIAFQTDNILVLGPMNFSIRLNVPTVLSLTYDSFPMIGCPILPVITLAYAHEVSSKWSWKRVIGGTKIAVGFLKVYTPTYDDIGAILEVECIPHNENGEAGLPFIYLPITGKKALKHSLVICVCAHEEIINRQILASTQQLEAKSFRVVTYNILLDAFCDNEWALKNIYPYVQQPYANIHLRKQQIFREVAGYNPDIVCFQEISASIYSDYFRAHFDRLGFDGIYANKATTQPFGSCVFVRRSRFSVREAAIIDLTQCWREYEPAVELCVKYPHMVSYLESTTTTGQLVLLQSLAPSSGLTSVAGSGGDDSLGEEEEEEEEEGGGGGSLNSQEVAIASSCSLGRICVINAHLFSNPEAPHIRTLQAALLLHEAHTRFPGVAVLFMGDFNADCTSGVYKFISTGSVGRGHPEWAEGARFGSKQSAHQKEREANWHAVLSGDEILLTRALFAALDATHSSSLSTELLQGGGSDGQFQIMPSDHIQASVGKLSVGILAEILRNSACEKAWGPLAEGHSTSVWTYAQYAAWVSDFKAANVEEFQLFMLRAIELQAMLVNSTLEVQRNHSDAKLNSLELVERVATVRAEKELVKQPEKEAGKEAPSTFSSSTETDKVDTEAERVAMALKVLGLFPLVSLWCAESDPAVTALAPLGDFEVTVGTVGTVRTVETVVVGGVVGAATAPPLADEPSKTSPVAGDDISPLQSCGRSSEQDRTVQTEFFPCLDLTHHFQLSTARADAQVTHCAGLRPEPAVIDHIFYDSTRLCLRPPEQQLPCISLQAVTEHWGGIPSPHFGSDHVSLIADFSFL